MALPCGVTAVRVRLNEVSQVTQQTPQMNSGYDAEEQSADAMCIACIVYCDEGFQR